MFSLKLRVIEKAEVVTDAANDIVVYRIQFVVVQPVNASQMPMVSNAMGSIQITTNDVIEADVYTINSEHMVDINV